MKIIPSIAAILVLAGCAIVPSNAPTYARAADPPQGETNVYIYRIGAFPILRTPTILIDGKRIFDPPEKSYTVVALPPGPHEFKVDWAWDTGWPDLTLPMSVDTQPLYIKISGSFTPKGARVYEAGSYAQRVAPAAAEAEMAQCCRYLAPKS